MDRLRYIVEDALTNIRRSGWGGLASVGTIAVSFIIMGIFLIITGNLGAVVAEWKEQFQVTVFLEDGITARKGDREIQVMDIAELMWQAVERTASSAAKS